MKKGIIFMLMLSIFSAMNLNAQHGGKYEDKDPQERAEMVAEKLQAKLDLTDDQKAQVYEMHLEAFNRKMELKENNRENREQLRSEMQQMRTEMDAKMSSILNAEQMKLYTQMKEERKAKMERHKEHRKNAPMDKQRAPKQ